MPTPTRALRITGRQLCIVGLPCPPCVPMHCIAWKVNAAPLVIGSHLRYSDRLARLARQEPASRRYDVRSRSSAAKTLKIRPARQARAEKHLRDAQNSRAEQAALAESLRDILSRCCEYQPVALCLPQFKPTSPATDSLQPARDITAADLSNPSTEEATVDSPNMSSAVAPASSAPVNPRPIPQSQSDNGHHLQSSFMNITSPPSDNATICSSVSSHTTWSCCGYGIISQSAYNGKTHMEGACWVNTTGAADWDACVQREGIRDEEAGNNTNIAVNGTDGKLLPGLTACMSWADFLSTAQKDGRTVKSTSSQ